MPLQVFSSDQMDVLIHNFAQISGLRNCSCKNALPIKVKKSPKNGGHTYFNACSVCGLQFYRMPDASFSGLVFPETDNLKLIEYYINIIKEGDQLRRVVLLDKFDEKYHFNTIFKDAIIINKLDEIQFNDIIIIDVDAIRNQYDQKGLDSTKIIRHFHNVIPVFRSNRVIGIFVSKFAFDTNLTISQKGEIRIMTEFIEKIKT